MKYCTNCGKELNENADFCMNCGKLINKKVVPKKQPFTWIFVLIAIFGFWIVFFISMAFNAYSEIEDNYEPFPYGTTNMTITYEDI